jgi:hypothetical protein
MISKLTKAGWAKRLSIMNQLIDKVNTLSRIRMTTSNNSSPSIEQSSNGITINVPDYSDQIKELEARVRALGG